MKSVIDGTFYVGSTQDIEERVTWHNEGRSKYTKPKRPWELVCFEECLDRSSATKREQEIKKHKRRAFIEDLVRTSRM